MLDRIRKRISTAHIYLFLLFILLLCIFQYGITKIYGMYLFPDEFGYWASAATALGYDWSEIAALGSYYSFGYSAVLLPILKFIENATNAYRAAILLNAVFSGISLYLIFHILTKIWKEAGDRTIACISGVAIFFPSTIYYMQVTLTESLLTVLFVAVSAVLLHYIENPRSSAAICLAMLLIYLYFVHMRTVGIVIACCITLLVLVVFDKKYVKPLFVFGTAICILAAGGMVVKQLLSESLYSAAADGSLAVNDYAGQVGKITALFSFRGIYQLITSCIGKLFYLGSATFGIFYWGIYFLLKKMADFIRQIRRLEKFRIQTIWFLFLFLAVLFHFMISALYMMEHVPNGRIDTLIYGRYNEILVPLMICFGLMAMFQNRCLMKWTAFMIVLQGFFAFVVYYLIRARELTQLYTCHIVGIRYAVDEMDFHIELFIRNVFIVSSLIGILIAGIIYFIKKKKEFYWLLCIVAAIEVLIGLSASGNDIYTHNEDNFRDYELAQSITDMGREDSEIMILDSGETSYAGILQFCLRNSKFTVIKTPDLLMKQIEKDALVLIASEAYGAEQIEKQLKEYYDSHLDSSHFDLYYNADEKRVSK